MCDSQAFQTFKQRRIGRARSKPERMTAWEAIEAQLAFERRLQREGAGPDFRFEAVVTYDQLVDEAVVNGKQVKRRAAEIDAVAMVEETLRSAYVYKHHEQAFAGAIAYAAQGATLRQYMDCVDALLPLMRPGKDWLALGGFCIIGIKRSLIPLFVQVCREVAPRLRRAGITRGHVLGVTVVDAVQPAAQCFADAGVEISFDSASHETNAFRGAEWKEEHMERWPGASPFDHVYKPGDHFHPADLALGNIERYVAWLRRQGGPERHRPAAVYRPEPPPQLDLFGAGAHADG